MASGDLSTADRTAIRNMIVDWGGEKTWETINTTRDILKKNGVNPTTALAEACKAHAKGIWKQLCDRTELDRFCGKDKPDWKEPWLSGLKDRTKSRPAEDVQWAAAHAKIPPEEWDEEDYPSSTALLLWEMAKEPGMRGEFLKLYQKTIPTQAQVQEVRSYGGDPAVSLARLEELLSEEGDGDELVDYCRDESAWEAQTESESDIPKEVVEDGVRE